MHRQSFFSMTSTIPRQTFFLHMTPTMPHQSFFYYDTEYAPEILPLTWHPLCPPNPSFNMTATMPHQSFFKYDTEYEIVLWTCLHILPKQCVYGSICRSSMLCSSTDCRSCRWFKLTNQWSRILCLDLLTLTFDLRPWYSRSTLISSMYMSTSNFVALGPTVCLKEWWKHYVLGYWNKEIKKEIKKERNKERKK